MTAKHQDTNQNSAKNTLTVDRGEDGRRRKEAASVRYLRQWRRQVEYAERLHRTSGYFYTRCECCDFAIRDNSRDRLETLVHRGGRRSHRLRVEVHRLDERFRAVTVERGAWASAPWWRRREPWTEPGNHRVPEGIPDDRDLWWRR